MESPNRHSPPKKYQRGDTFCQIGFSCFLPNFLTFSSKMWKCQKSEFWHNVEKTFWKRRKEQEAEKHQFPQFKASLKKSKFHRLTKILLRLRAYLFFVFAQISWKDNYAGFSILHVGYSAKLGCLLIGRFGLKNQKQ